MKDYVITLGYPKKMTYGHTYGNAFVWAAMALTQTQPGKPSFFRASEIRADKTSQNSRLIFVNSSPSSMQARMASYQMAFRMQREVPGVLSLENESWETRQLYGVDDPATSSFGSRCLLARKLVKEGVRFVQGYPGNWDSHDYIHRAHGHLIQSVDQPIAGLLRDLKRTGLLDEKLVVFAGEFGRTPDNGMRGGGCEVNLFPCRSLQAIEPVRERDYPPFDRLIFLSQLQSLCLD